MDSNIIKFRLSPDFLQLLESAKNGDESLHQVARRILESNLKSGTQLGHAQAELVHNEQIISTQLQDTIRDTTFDPDVLKQQLKDELRSELVGEINEAMKVNLADAKAELLGE